MGNHDLKIQDSASIGSDDEKIGKLLGALKRVEAPGDFDFRVRARIAAGKPVEKATSWVPSTVRLAVPLVLLLLVGGYFGFSGFYFSNDIDVSAVAAVDIPAVAIKDPENFEPLTGSLPTDGLVLTTTEMTADRIETGRFEVANDEFVQKPGKTVVPHNRRDDRPVGGSYNIAQRVANSRVPVGTNADLTTPPVQPSASAVLAAAGIDVQVANGVMKVQKVAAGGSAERSGVRPGDVIVSILNRTLIIRRDDKTMRIDLKP